MAFLSAGIYPGSEKTLLTYDLRSLYLPLYGYISNPGPGFNNLFHSMSGGLGGNNYATVILCISPLDVIYSIIPLRLLPCAVYFMILFKTGLCGLALCIYIRLNEKIKLSCIMTVMLSCCYGLMSYNVMYFIAPMWFDCVFLLPLLSLALEKIIAGKKNPVFTVLMAICIIDDYYIAYMAVIALIIFFVFRSAEDGIGLKQFIRNIFLFAFHGLLSAGISMFVILPAALDLGRGKLAAGNSGITGQLIKNSVLDILLGFRCGSYAGMDFNASPNIFCGSVVVILALVWFLSGKKKPGARIAGLFVIAFYFASFIYGPLDRAWHGFREPISFSVRYAFTFSFFMILFAIRGAEFIKEKKVRIPHIGRLIISLAICLFTMIELFLNAGQIIRGVESELGFTCEDEYLGCCNLYEKLLPSDDGMNSVSFARISNPYPFSGNEGALFGYNGIARFSSSYNFGVVELFGNLGSSSSGQSIGEIGLTAPALGLFDAGYVISNDDLSELYDPDKEYEGYTLYENWYKLPFAYAVNDTCETEEFGTDPFLNQNLIYDELFGSADDKIELFSEVPCVPDSDNDLSVPAGIRSSERVRFTSEKCGHYYFCVEFGYEIAPPVSGSDSAGTGYITIIRNYEFDGRPGEYGNGQYSYCVDLGYLNEGEEHILSLQSSNVEVGEIRVYYYNDDVYRDISSGVNGYDISRIDKKGIILNGTSEKEEYVLVTLPCEDGYSVYVDGVKTDYESYRNSLMRLKVSPGTHEIEIRYFPPGLKPGIIISILSAICLLLYALIGHKGKNKTLRINPST